MRNARVGMLCGTKWPRPLPQGFLPTYIARHKFSVWWPIHGVELTAQNLLFRAHHLGVCRKVVPLQKIRIRYPRKVLGNVPCLSALSLCTTSHPLSPPYEFPEPVLHPVIAFGPRCCPALRALVLWKGLCPYACRRQQGAPSQGHSLRQGTGPANAYGIPACGKGKRITSVAEILGRPAVVDTGRRRCQLCKNIYRE